MVSFKLAIRNIKMNFRRYVLLCIVFFLATTALIFNFIGADALKTSMENACVRIFTGNVMVKNPDYGFRLGMAVSGTPDLVTDVHAFMDKCDGIDDVKGSVARIRRGVQVSAEKTEYMNLLGVDVEREKKYSEFGVIEGKENMDSGEALISGIYLKKLNLKVGDTVGISTVSAAGLPVRKDFKIVGILKDRNLNFLRQDSIVIRYEDAQVLLEKEDVATEVLVYTKQKDCKKSTLAAINEAAKASDGAAYKWDEVGNEIVYASLGSYASILFLALACIVIICALVYNLTAMSIYSQMRTIGTMLALGMTHGKVLLKFICENIVIGILSCGVSAIFTTLGVVALDSKEIPMGVAAEIFGSEYLSLRVNGGMIILVAVGVALTSIISTLIAFRRIKRIKPIEAIVQ